MRPKALLCINGDEVVDKVAAGEAEIGSTFISEIVSRAGMTVVGPLPPEIGNGTLYAAGVAAGQPQPRGGAPVHRVARGAGPAKFLESRAASSPPAERWRDYRAIWLTISTRTCTAPSQRRIDE